MLRTTLLVSESHTSLPLWRREPVGLAPKARPPSFQRVARQFRSRQVPPTLAKLLRGGQVAVQAVYTEEATQAGQEERAIISTQNHDCGLHVELAESNGVLELNLWHDQAKARLLHWAVEDWELPPQQFWPQGTNQAGDKAVETPFHQHVQMRFPASGCPRRIVFVMKETEGEEVWVNNNGVGFSVQLAAPPANEVMAKILDAEGTWEHYSLFNRFILANESLDALDAAGPEGMGFLYAWLRLSNQRHLDWYRNSNYQSKDIAHVQKVLAQRTTEKAGNSKHPWGRVFARLALGQLPRGGGNGDAIRMGILDVMRNNGIKEGHRPGIEEHFLEQWHQKLHTNTTPEDVVICEAYLSFLHSGNMDDYYRTLWDRGNITRDMLANMDHPIRAEPMHLPHMIGAVKHYLWILKTTHSGVDLDVALEMCKMSLDDDLRWHMFDTMDNRNEWWVPGKIVELRNRLKPYWTAPGANRDLLLLDVALDDWFRLQIERVDKGSLDGDSIINLVSLVIDNATITAESEELNQCGNVWRRLKEGGRWSPEWALKALAAVERTQISLSTYMDAVYRYTQPAAEELKAACGIEEKYILNFGEEVIRGQPLFVLSLLLKQLEPMVRNTAGVAAWQIVSHVTESKGLVVCQSLSEVQGERFAEPTVLLTPQVGGMEDIPSGVVAVLTRSSTDVLSHVAIRARSSGVMLATCWDEGLWQDINNMQGSHVALTVTTAGGVTAVKIDAPTAKDSSSGPASSSNGVKPVAVPKTRQSAAWALSDDQFGEGLVGGKALNLVSLRQRVGSAVQVPSSVSLPFGTFDRVLADPANQSAAGTITKLTAQLSEHKDGTGMPSQLSKLRDIIQGSLQTPAELRSELTAVAEGRGLIPAGHWRRDEEWQAVWTAVCQVWASKWSDRAWLSRRAYGIPDDKIQMAVLLQKVVPAQYAFVIHTAHPVTGQAGEIFGEVVPGLGETLVGNHPGQPLSFSAASEGVPKVLSYPSKQDALWCPNGGPAIIARSDSNGEDLEDFAGAGLYDSVMVSPAVSAPVDVAGEALMWDEEFTGKLLSGMVNVGKTVESAFQGMPQDIEGVWVNGGFTVVQSRPQKV